jgi:hypothetical protein
MSTKYVDMMQTQGIPSPWQRLLQLSPESYRQHPGEA